MNLHGSGTFPSQSKSKFVTVTDVDPQSSNGTVIALTYIPIQKTKNIKTKQERNIFNMSVTLDDYFSSLSIA